MGQILHGCARTTQAVRRAIQLQQESIRALARRFGVSPTTNQKWRKRTTTTDAAMGPKKPRSTVLTPEHEAIVVAFRRHTLLPWDECLYTLQPCTPYLTRSTLHRCLERHDITRVPNVEGDKPGKKNPRAIRSATLTSISPRSGPKRATCVYSWPSTAPASSPSFALSRAPARWKQRSSSAT